jgi:hypothetical protein
LSGVVIQSLITEINDALGNGADATSEALGKVLSPGAVQTLASLPSESHALARRTTLCRTYVSFVSLVR